MGMRECIVCKRHVPEGYERDHINANHLGPHTFWFGARRFQTMEPSMTIAEIARMANASLSYQIFEEREGGDIGRTHGEAVDLTRQPHFYAVPPATH